jgi:hypothetical protein
MIEDIAGYSDLWWSEGLLIVRGPLLAVIVVPA